jgi:hypothetical protein
MKATVYESFGDELVKIAIYGTMAKGFGTALKEGWKNSGGRFGKALTIGVPAFQIPHALKKEDPSGMGRTRTERTTGLVGDAVGGLAGLGAGTLAANRLSNKLKLTRGRGALGLAGEVVGGAIGSGLGHRILSAPSEMMRHRRESARLRQAIDQPPTQGIAV